MPPQGRHPQQHDVDAAVGHVIEPQRPRDLAGCVGGVPGLDPGTHAGFQLGDDLIGDAAVDIDALRGHAGLRSDSCEVALAMAARVLCRQRIA